MTELEKIAMTKVIVGEDAALTDDDVQKYLLLARARILNKMYPFGQPSPHPEVPARYHYVQCELAARLFLRKGAEGEKAHNENGISRTYGNTDDSDILAAVIQVAKIC